MVDAAQQNVKTNAEEQEQQINVQRLLDKETKRSHFNNFAFFLCSLWVKHYYS